MDEVFDSAIDVGAEDVEVDDEGNLVIWTEPADTMAAAKALAAEYKMKIQDSDVLWDAVEDTKVPIDSDETLTTLISLVTKLQEEPGVQAIYANCTKGDNVSEELWEELQEKIPV